MRPAFILLLAAAAAAAQETQPAPPDFRAATALVRVDVQVLDRGKALTGLSREDFELADEGVPQPIGHFGRETEPLELLFVLDVSGSMGRLLADIARGALQALAVLEPHDTAGVLLFARTARLELEPTAERTAAARILAQAAVESGLGAGSEIHASLVEAARYLEGRPQAGRRAVVILTDNRGLQYRQPVEGVLRVLSAANIVLTAVVPPSAKPPPGVKENSYRNPDFPPADVFRLARDTGGEVVRTDRLEGRFADLLARVRTRYSLHYRPPAATSGEFRRITVRLAAEARRRYPRAEVRARAGYFAP